jgi:hypothetical protein
MNHSGAARQKHASREPKAEAAAKKTLHLRLLCETIEQCQARWIVLETEPNGNHRVKHLRLKFHQPMLGPCSTARSRARLDR